MDDLDRKYRNKDGTDGRINKLIHESTAQILLVSFCNEQALYTTKSRNINFTNKMKKGNCYRKIEEHLTNRW